MVMEIIKGICILILFIQSGRLINSLKRIKLKQIDDHLYYMTKF